MFLVRVIINCFMGNNNACTCLKKETAEEQRFEYVVFSGKESVRTPRKELKVQYARYDINTSDLNSKFDECSFTKACEETNSKSVNTLNADADQLSIIERRY